MRHSPVRVDVAARHAGGVVALLEHRSAIAPTELADATHGTHRLVHAVHD
jgi:hypothetical protein